MADGATPALSPQTAFLVLGGVFGLFFALATPPHDPPDEVRHHARAYLISEGRLAVIGAAPGHEGSVPGSIVRLHPPGRHLTDAQRRRQRIPLGGATAPPHTVSGLWRELARPLLAEDRIEVRYVTSYNPVVYAPTALALGVARLLDLSALAGLYLARLANLACWLLGMFLVLRRAPKAGWLLAAAALLPMSVFQAGSVSGDPPTQIVVFWLLAELLRSFDPAAGRLARPEALRLLAVSLLLGVVKPGYAPLVLGAAWIPAARLAPRPRAALVLVMLLAAAAPTVGWAALIAVAEQPPLVPGADFTAQLGHVLRQPFDFLAALGRTALELAPAWIEGLVGNLGHLEVELPLLAVGVGLAALLASAVLDREPDVARAARLGLLATSAITAVAVLTMAYLGWTAVGAPVVQGVQGRYFLPLLPFALLSVPRLAGMDPALLRTGVLWALGTVLAVAALETVRTYYAF